MKKVLFTILLFIFATSFGASLYGKGMKNINAGAQFIYNQKRPMVRSCRPKAFTLKPGKSKYVYIYGRYFDQVVRARVIFNNRIARGFSCRITRKKTSSMAVTILARTSVKPAKYYQLRLLNRKGKTLLNISKGLLKFSVTQPSNSKADLIVTRIVQDPVNPLFHSSWKFKVTIKNQGTANAFIPKGRQYMAHNGKGSWNGITAGSNLTIKPGGTHTGIQYAAALPAGTHPITYKVDPENVVPESNESNNQKTVRYTVRKAVGRPDLVITNITRDHTSAQVKLVVTIKNRGTNLSNLQGYHLILKSTNTNNILQKGNLHLNPGQSKKVTCYAANLSPGTFTWTIKVDPSNKVLESNENNNTRNVRLTIR